MHGIDYDETFAPVAKMDSICLTLAIAVVQGWEVHQMDVKNAFLHGDLSEEIYMEQPEGFKAKGQENKVIRLRKALYGLKQAGLVWWRTLDRSMTELGFTRLKSDAGIFVKYDGGERIIAIIYVDDAIFAGQNKVKVLCIKKRFM